MGSNSVRFVVVAGNTGTAAIEGISAAGATADLRRHTPAADLEILAFGEPVEAPVTPVSPGGCPTPAVVTRAVSEFVDVGFTALDAGLAAPTAATTEDLGRAPGRDVREPVAVPDAADVFAAAREFARDVPADELFVGETIPGGTTTAMAVLRALGERDAVSSSLPENPLALKRAVVADGLAASDLDAGDLREEPLEAVRTVGDPVLAAVAGLVAGAADADVTVTLAGGTQLAAAAAVARHADVEAPLSLATTRYLVADDSADVHGLAADLDLELTVTDPGFDADGHPSLAHYADGVAKEGVGMGGALALADRRDVPMPSIRDRAAGLAGDLRATAGVGRQ